MSTGEQTGRGWGTAPRPRPGRRVLTSAVVATALVGGAFWVGGTAAEEGRRGNALVLDQQARNAGQQVLGGQREPGVPSVQRVRHDDVVFTVTVAPARPGPNLVRVDATPVGGGTARPHGHRSPKVYVGTAEDDASGRMRLARPRPGSDGLWAEVDLPEGTGTVLLTHGRWHRVPFAVETGTSTPDAGAQAAWTGSDGPECLTAATAAVLGGGPAPDACPSSRLTDTDRAALEQVVATLADRGLQELAVEHDTSPRSAAAYDVVSAAARQAGLRVVEPGAAPGERNALLVVSGWADAARHLADVSRLPLRRQPIRSDGTWLAPWLLSPGVVDSTAGAVLPLDFDIRDPEARAFSDALVTYLPGQAPTASAYTAWRAARGVEPAPLRLFAASRAAYMPAVPGHAGHETEVAWFPGGTVTPVTLSR